MKHTCDCDASAVLSYAVMRWDLEKEMETFEFPSQNKMIEELQAKIEANELSISAACRQMNIGAGTYYRMRDQYKKEHGVPNVPNSE